MQGTKIRQNTLELAVGAFVVLAILALAVMAFQVSGMKFVDKQSRYQVHAYFTNIAGLTERAKVVISGVVVGEVDSISLDPYKLAAKVSMSIDNEVDFISIDSIVAIQTAGVLGERYISISLGADDEMVGEGDVIDDTAPAMVLEDLIGKFMQAFAERD